MPELVDPTSRPMLFRGADIEIPAGATWVRCPDCSPQKNGHTRTVLFRGMLSAGTILEVQCRRCKKMHRFEAREIVAEEKA